MVLLKTQRLVSQLAAGTVSARDQALYLVVSALTWILPYYFFVIPPQFEEEPTWFWFMWGYEFLVITFINTAGYFYCLKQCTIDPDRNFLIDFCCLYPPCALITITVAWSTYHLLVQSSLALGRAGTPSYPWLEAIWLSPRFFDILRFVAYAGSTAIIFLRVATLMKRVSLARSAPNKGFQPSALP